MIVWCYKDSVVYGRFKLSATLDCEIINIMSRNEKDNMQINKDYFTRDEALSFKLFLFNKYLGVLHLVQ